MATPQSLNVLLVNRTIISIPNVVSETVEHLDYYDGSNYRNILGAAELGRQIASRGPETIMSGTGPFTGTGWDEEFTIDGPTSDSFTGTRVWEDKAFEKDDRYNEVDPRSEKKQRTRYCWWAGESYVFPVTTALNSTTVTVSSTSAFTVGQNIASTGLPPNAKVLEILSGTTLRVSQAATAAGSVTGVISSGQLQGHFWADEVLGAFVGGTGQNLTSYGLAKRLA